MDESRAVTAIAVAGSVCSITGISLLGIVGFYSEQPLIPAPVVAVTGLILAGLAVAVWMLRGRLVREMELREGRIITVHDRSSASRSFTGGTLRTLRVFAGDLSWLEEDLAAYRALIERGVTIQILTDAPAARAIPVGKALGIQFREYPRGMEAPLKASVSDAEEESESRALVVKRRTHRPGTTGGGEYGYWMKEYHGSIEYAAIRSMMLLFDEFFAVGSPL